MAFKGQRCFEWVATPSSTYVTPARKESTYIIPECEFGWYSFQRKRLQSWYSAAWSRKLFLMGRIQWVIPKNQRVDLISDFGMDLGRRNLKISELVNIPYTRQQDAYGGSLIPELSRGSSGQANHLLDRSTKLNQAHDQLFIFEQLYCNEYRV